MTFSTEVKSVATPTTKAFLEPSDNLDSIWKSQNFLNPRVWLRDPTASLHVSKSTLERREYEKF